MNIRIYLSRADLQEERNANCLVRRAGDPCPSPAFRRAEPIPESALFTPLSLTLGGIIRTRRHDYLTRAVLLLVLGLSLGLSGCEDNDGAPGADGADGPDGANDQLRKRYFTEHSYGGTKSCLNCHGKLADEVLETAHYSSCIGIASSEGRCMQCHVGYGYADATYD